MYWNRPFEIQTIQNLNFKMFGFWMSSLFECSEFEPPLYFKGSNARLDKELNTKHVQYSNGKSFYDCQFVHFLMQKHPKNCSFSTDRFCCREASEIQFFSWFWMLITSKNQSMACRAFKWFCYSNIHYWDPHCIYNAWLVFLCEWMKPFVKAKCQSMTKYDSLVFFTWPFCSISIGL